MQLSAPDRTPYDFHFMLMGFPVRVTPFFWVAAAVLGWDEANAYDAVPLLDANGNEVPPFPGYPGSGPLLLLWIAAMFVSILIHELGHALAMRRYGMDASVVLYHFGGLAIPDSFSSVGAGWRRRGRANQLIISAAGPAAQLLLAAVVIVAVELAGYSFAIDIWPLSRWLQVTEKPMLPASVGAIALYYLAAPSVYWALLNLLPIFPLDGGQIARELLVRSQGNEGIGHSLWLSLGTSIAAGVYAYQNGQAFMAMFFLSFAVSSYQLIQMTRFGGGRW